MNKAEAIFNKTADVSPEHAGGTLAGGLVATSVGRQKVLALERVHYFTKGKGLSKTFKVGVMLPTIAAGAGVGYLIGQGIDKIFRKKGEFMKEDVNKAEVVFDKLEKNAVNWAAILGKIGKGLSKAQVKAAPLVAKGKAGAKAYGKNVKRDITVLKGTHKVKGPFAEAARKKALVGLAGRVGLPAYVAADVLS